MTSREIVHASCVAVIGWAPPPETRLCDVADSLKRTEIGVEIEERLDLDIREAEHRVETVGELVAAVERATLEAK